MSPTAKKLEPASLSRVFEAAEESTALSENDRAALREAAADPRWIRMSRGDAFERLVCDDE